MGQTRWFPEHADHTAMDILIFYESRQPPVSCREAAELDSALQQIASETHQKLVANISAPQVCVHIGVGIDPTFVCVCGHHEEDDEYWISVGDESAKGLVELVSLGGTYTVGRCNLVPTETALLAVRELMHASYHDLVETGHLPRYFPWKHDRWR